ncbi:PGPGW domain-containing protein [Nocardioides sp. R-C-SC26]|uniref:PGPGW domain-containing protein n=1 Tax=Nocardioides sp. R-C-SC26 TaxID=2870414 RepID=UPI001E586FF2|nr:PGPGW domain-containing protein [Nocardioides sp. R-C-SC26]
MLVAMMGAARRLALETIGWVLLVAGIAALVLPGPGLLMIFGALAILSQQYEWAEKRLDPIKYRALRGAAESVETVPRIVMSLSGVVLLVAAGALWLAEPDEPDWWPLPEALWLPGGAATAVTQLVSAAIALALIVYSFRRFYGKPEARAALDAEVDEADREYREL